MFTSRQLWLMAHLGLGVVFIHAFAGGIATLLPRGTAATRGGHYRPFIPSRVKASIRAVSTAGMAVVAWLTVLTGTWIVYPWYHAQPPPGVSDIAYPESWLSANPGLSVWHEFGMEWKMHVGWLAPFLATAVAFVVLRCPRALNEDRALRKAVTTYFALAFAVAVVAGLLGAVVNNVAPNQFLTSQ
ncbi:MAG: hypothetical protein ACRD0K_08980 [Egibacteraceae bacterium]